jgi:hypothetical protein
MKHEAIVVHAMWDSEAGVWTASGSDIGGLAVEAGTIDRLRQRVPNALSDLIELNGLDLSYPQIPVHFLAQSKTRLADPSKHRCRTRRAS